eukprot:680177-Hanusia_phi.AAC.3
MHISADCDSRVESLPGYALPCCCSPQVCAGGSRSICERVCEAYLQPVDAAPPVRIVTVPSSFHQSVRTSQPGGAGAEAGAGAGRHESNFL